MADTALQILALNAFNPMASAQLSRDVAELVTRRQRSFGQASVLFYEEPLHVVAGIGTELITIDGTPYLDLYNNVPSVGHCHPRVVSAVRAQVGRLNIHSRYLFDVVHDYAEQLLATFPAPLTNVLFTCTGSESNDLALRLARLVTGGLGVVVTKTAYHGNTTAVTEVSPSSYKKGAPPAHVRTVPPPHRAYYGDDIAGGFARAVGAAITAMANDGIRFAALLVDSIFSSDGVFADPPGFLAEAAALVRAKGGLLIADEVQPGFGRTGAGHWGFARHGVVPDIVTMGKPMGNGMPIGGVVTRPDLLADFAESFGYFNTFGGNPVASAAALAVLNVIKDEDLIGNANRVGNHMMASLRDLSARHPAIGEVRGAGLYVGVDIVNRGTGRPDPAETTRLINRLRERHILIGAAGPFGATLKIRPPLCLSVGEVDRFIDALDDSAAA
ncbi:2,2-dialkylglycine decarboxylase [Blastochloris viridis]|uniref:2,2-dialkylglycine decarboxylase n=2 Tax=Blastochloris viridis TaxID=1079 RepID=A0A0H5BFX4_BLAVI|nr:2,2-dialkylglycine decarboxylase [Blastochloris viridis]BAR99266.1 aminotransferase class-III [Blastochloris viridis]CUU43429.1 2,2-dialkylglycine decarboxylase [Blastochloris viridis]